MLANCYSTVSQPYHVYTSVTGSPIGQIIINICLNVYSVELLVLTRVPLESPAVDFKKCKTNIENERLVKLKI